MAANWIRRLTRTRLSDGTGTHLPRQSSNPAEQSNRQHSKALRHPTWQRGVSALARRHAQLLRDPVPQPRRQLLQRYVSLRVRERKAALVAPGVPSLLHAHAPQWPPAEERRLLQRRVQ